MKNIKALLAGMLCLTMLFSFAACGDKKDTEDPTDEGTTTAQQTEEKLQPLEEVGLSLKKLSQANKIESLMKENDVITVKFESSDGSSYIRQVFKYDGDIAYAQKSADAVSGYIKGFEFAVENDRVKAYRDIDELEDGEEFGENDIITDLFEDKKLVAAGETEKEYKIKSLSEDETKKGTRYFYFEKESLTLTKVTFENSVGNKENVEVIYNGELEDFSKKITDSFDGEMKAVTIVAEIIGDNAVSNVSVKLNLPADWEYVPSGDGRIDYYMDEEMSQPYEYPGHGKGYTLYVSNFFDDYDDSKK